MDGPDPPDGDEETPLQQVAAGLAIGTTLLVAFGLLALDYRFFWIAFPVGFAGLLPLAVGLARLYERRLERGRTAAAPDDREVALARLRERYAEGEIDEAEFEERVERLLQTENVDDARAYLDGREQEATTAGDRSANREAAETERD
jgi:uncharacterized membrane protein